MKEINKVNTDGNCIKTLSVWKDTFPVPDYSSLEENVSTDVCIDKEIILTYDLH